MLSLLPLHFDHLLTNKNLIFYDHYVVSAFSPKFALEYMMRHKFDGWRSLGGILLAFTGECLTTKVPRSAMADFGSKGWKHCSPTLVHFQSSKFYQRDEEND